MGFNRVYPPEVDFDQVLKDFKNDVGITGKD
jgi:hypothetical protein